MGENETKQTGSVMLTLRLHSFKAQFGKRWQIAGVEDADAIVAVHPLVLVICPADKLTPRISINLCSTQPSSSPGPTLSSCLSQARGTVLPAGSDIWRCWLWTGVDCTLGQTERLPRAATCSENKKEEMQLYWDSRLAALCSIMLFCLKKKTAHKMKPLSNPKSPQTICLFSAATTHQFLDLHQEKLLGPEGEEGQSVHIAPYSHGHYIQTLPGQFTSTSLNISLSLVITSSLTHHTKII